jgi:metal-responsive CopG/Arc/MetJ family transcriptional regulator
MKELRKTKWTVTVKPQLCEEVDAYVKLHGTVNRSTVVERALELWLARQLEEEEEAYYQKNAAELNTDSKSWLRITRESAKRTWK